jgi:acetyltransferase-like isoleucine patch superfamily enzyme
VRALSALRLGIHLLANEYRKGQLGSCGLGVRIHGRFEVTGPRHLHLGHNVHINRNALIRAEGGVHIGDNTHIARNLTLYSINHDFRGDCLPYDHRQIAKPVRIGRNVWIGIGVTIAPGSTIGDGAILAMGSVVSGEVPPGAIVGMPAWRVIGNRDPERYRALDASARYGGMSGYLWENPRPESAAAARRPGPPPPPEGDHD